MNIIQIDSADSTNFYLKSLLQKEFLQEGTFVICREQTAGRGQAGNSWESEAGKNLTFSVVFYPIFLSIKEYFLLSKAVSLGVKDALNEYVDDIRIKWPNDIYYKNKKIVGILIENELLGQNIQQSILGIGVNINQDIFRSNAPNPVSLKQITGQDYNLNELIETFANKILFRYESLRSGGQQLIEGDYHQSLYCRDIYSVYQDKNGLFRARIEQVDNSGFLHLLTGEGERREYAFKEVCKVL